MKLKELYLQLKFSNHLNCDHIEKDRCLLLIERAPVDEDGKFVQKVCDVC
jgi:hypothetical protein